MSKIIFLITIFAISIFFAVILPCIMFSYLGQGGPGIPPRDYLIQEDFLDTIDFDGRQIKVKVYKIREGCWFLSDDWKYKKREIVSYEFIPLEKIKFEFEDEDINREKQIIYNDSVMTCYNPLGENRLITKECFIDV